ncbi:uncharacterized protein LOC8268420 isoform X1 [Ricinus communis]|uniref:uncharacterized protein LOC8268420 isoform X1 n=2 Tax=Ricinus communis TaxID=3988 RepID=UPI00201A3C8A|nr:uncharacterized protein LOC8268420 isoform X1 [Ricinus communis]
MGVIMYVHFVLIINSFNRKKELSAMAVAFTNLSWWLWSGKHQDPRIPNASSLNSRPDLDLWESDNLKFPLVRRANVASSSRRVKRKWHSREERKIDREYDVVLVPSDGGCVSGSESDDSDYSIGWLEPHGAGFQSDDDMDSSFAVLVPCYGRAQDKVFEDSKNNMFGAIVNIQDGFSNESKRCMEEWLSSLQNS